MVTAPIYRGVARRLAQWHAVLPTKGATPPLSQESAIIAHAEAESAKQEEGFEIIQPRRGGPSMWAVLQKWILALPASTPEQRSRRLSLQQELQWVLAQLDDGKGIGEDGVRYPLPPPPTSMMCPSSAIPLIVVFLPACFLTL